jgi:hypothetical protein
MKRGQSGTTAGEYNHSKRMKKRAAVLDGVAAELRRTTEHPVR